MTAPVLVEILDEQMERHDYPDQLMAPRVGDYLYLDRSALLVVEQVTWVYSREWPTRVVVRTTLAFPPRRKRTFIGDPTNHPPRWWRR